MHDIYSDDYSSVAVEGADRLIPEGVRRLAGAAVFVTLVAGMGLWSYRLGTRDAGQVPVIKAIDGPARIQPDDPGGLQAAHQGLEVNSVLAGAPARPATDAVVVPRPAPSPITAEDEPQGELVLKAPAALAERVAGDAAPLPQQDDAVPDLVATALPADADPADPDAVLGDAEATDAAMADDDDAAPAAAGPRPRSRPTNLSFARARAAAPERPAVKPAATATTVAAVATAAAPAPTPAAASAPASREVARPTTGSRLVQLGAFDNEEMARKAWGQLVARNGDLLGSKSLWVERTTANARVFYRLRVAGFTNAEQTRQMCASLRARGIACIPVTLQ